MRFAEATRQRRGNSRKSRSNFAKPEIGIRNRTGWLGRQDSNLGMAESKSDKFFNDFKVHSE
jgi:hypothetical protein